MPGEERKEREERGISDSLMLTDQPCLYFLVSTQLQDISISIDFFQGRVGARSTKRPKYQKSKIALPSSS